MARSADRLRGNAGDLGRPLRRLLDAVGNAVEIRQVGRARRCARRQVVLVEAQHVGIAIGLVVQALARDHIGHGDQRRGVGRGLDEDVLVGQHRTRPRAARVDADDAHALLLGQPQVLPGAGAEGAVAGAPAPHQDQLGVDVVGGLAPGALVDGLGAEGHAHGEDLGLGRHVRPQLRAAAEPVEEALRRRPSVQRRQAARARGIEDRGVAVGSAHTQHLARDLVERLLPGDALELAAAARAGAPQRMLQPVGVVDALDLAEATRAGLQRGQIGLPLGGIGGDARDAAVDHVRVHHAAAAAVVPAGAGDDGLARLGRHPGPLIDRPLYHRVLHSRQRRHVTRVVQSQLADRSARGG